MRQRAQRPGCGRLASRLVAAAGVAALCTLALLLASERAQVQRCKSCES